MTLSPAPPCAASSIFPAEPVVPMAGGTITVSLVMPSGCTLTATSLASWLSATATPTPGADAQYHRPDLVPLVGASKAACGWGLTNLLLPAGDYTVVAYGWSTATGQFDNVRITTVSVR